MHRSPSIVPETDDREIYLVLDDFGGHLGRAWPEADEERTDRETVIIDLMDGQFSNPVRVVAFNTAEGWSRDLSEEIADELRQRLRLVGGLVLVARLQPEGGVLEIAEELAELRADDQAQLCPSCAWYFRT